MTLAWVIGASLATAAEEQLPLVGALGEIQAPNFRQTLGQEVAGVELFMAEQLVQQCNQYFNFCRWGVATEPQVRTNMKAALKLVLTGEEVEVGYRIGLAFAAVGRQQSIPLTTVPSLLLYEASDPYQPTQDPQRLKTVIRTNLHQHLLNPDTRLKLQEAFLAKIPITKRLTVQAHRLVIPFSRSVLQADEGSLFTARFEAQPPAQPRHAVVIKMEPDAARSDPLQCLVVEFQHPDIIITQRGSWDDRIAQCQQHAVNGAIPVFVERYKRASPVQDDIIFDPDPEVP